MANPNALIIEVVGDTSKLTRGLGKAERDLKRFANRASSWDRRNARTGPAGGILSDLDRDRRELEDLQRRLSGVGDETDAVGRRMGSTALRATALGLALHVVGTNLSEAGGNAGKFGDALGKLTSGNIVGMVQALKSVDDTNIEQLTASLIEENTAARNAQIGNALLAQGLDDLGQAHLDAAAQITAAQASLPKNVFGTMGGLLSPFGIPSVNRPNPRPRLPSFGTPFPADRPGTTAGQRNQFFDTRIARELDRVQDLATVAAQTATLRAIAAEIQNRIDATKDITRRLNLEDQLLDVQRRAEQISTGAAKESARLAAERAAAEKERLAKLRQANLARQQSRDDLALGLQTPGVPNLRRQLAQLTSRSDIGSIPNRLAASLEGARRILNRKWSTISEDSRSNIASLFQTIRDELNQGTTGGPLTKTTQLSENILAGLGLSTRDTRTLRARISRFNSAGVALTGTGSGALGVTVPVTVNMDGRVVASTSAKYTRRGRQANPTQRNGPNAGIVVS